MATQLKKKVSKKKRRYIDKEINVDLDLSYITERIIAMGFPSEGTEGIYRNPMPEVQKFLEYRHKDSYKVYNLCSERAYDHKKFHGRVARYPFDDHNCPNFEDLYKFCVDVKQWLDGKPSNIAVIHCKAGKGRTGLMICCWLLFNKEWKTSVEAQTFYAAARTYNQKGVTIPSQIRYINYFERRLANNGPLPYKTLLLNYILIHHLPRISVDTVSVSISKDAQCIPLLSESFKTNVLYKDQPAIRKTLLKNYEPTGVDRSGYGEMLVLPIRLLPLCGDIKIKIAKLAHFWINTAFIDSGTLVLRKDEIDKVHKDKKHKVFPPNISIELIFSSDASLGDLSYRTTAAMVPEVVRNQAQLSMQQLMQQYPTLRNL